MEYNKIVSVTGLPGLFELVNTKSDGAIVRSLDDKTQDLHRAGFTIFHIWNH
jgi:hypothetical protein